MNNYAYYKRDEIIYKKMDFMLILTPNTKSFSSMLLIVFLTWGNIAHTQTQWLRAAKPIIGSMVLGVASCLALQRLTFQYAKKQQEPKKACSSRLLSEDEQTHQKLDNKFRRLAQKVSANIIGGLLSGGAAYMLSLALGFERKSVLPTLATIGAYATCAITSWHASRAMLRRFEILEQWKKNKKNSKDSVQANIKELQALEQNKQTHRAEKQKKEAEQQKRPTLPEVLERTISLCCLIETHEYEKNKTAYGFPMIQDTVAMEARLKEIRKALKLGASPHMPVPVLKIRAVKDGVIISICPPGITAFQLALENQDTELIMLLLNHSKADTIIPYIEQLKAIGHEIRNHPLVLQVQPQGFYEQLKA